MTISMFLLLKESFFHAHRKIENFKRTRKSEESVSEEKKKVNLQASEILWSSNMQ